MLINEVRELVFDFANKNQTGGYLGDDSYNLKIGIAQREVIDEALEFLDFNQLSLTLLSDILNTANAPVNAQGFVTLPLDYYKYADANALIFTDGNFAEHPIDYVGVSERGERLRSKIVNPTLIEPIATETKLGLRIDPKEVSLIELTYAVQPPDPEWVGTDTVPPVFDPALSTDLILSNKFKAILVYKVCSYFGIEIKDVSLYQATTKELMKSLVAQ